MTRCPSSTWIEEDQNPNPAPTDAEILKTLDAYGHLSYVVGYSDKWLEEGEEVCECPSRSSDCYVYDAEVEEKFTLCSACGKREDRGDWLACADFRVFVTEAGEIKVAYHVVVNSDSGGFIEGVEEGVVPAQDAPFDLLDRWGAIGTYDGVYVKEEERKANDEANEKWNRHLRQVISLQRDLGDGEVIPYTDWIEVAGKAAMRQREDSQASSLVSSWDNLKIHMEEAQEEFRKIDFSEFTMQLAAFVSMSELQADYTLQEFDQLCAASYWLDCAESIHEELRNILTDVRSDPQKWVPMIPRATRILAECPPRQGDPSRALWMAIRAVRVVEPPNPWGGECEACGGVAPGHPMGTVIHFCECKQQR